MARWKQWVRKLFFPRTAAAAAIFLGGMGLLAFALLFAREEGLLAYACYGFSAYALAVACLNLPASIRRANQRLMSHPLVSAYWGDELVKACTVLFFSLGANLLYAGCNAVSGIVYGSPWFGSLAVYYLLLSGMRLLLAASSRKQGMTGNTASQWRRYLLCGALLIPMNFALAAVVVLTLKQRGGFHYGKVMIYIMALYAFYAAISGVVNLARSRKFRSPLLSATRVVSLTAGLVSLFALEVAMLEQFGRGETLRYVMTASTGGGVCLILVTMSLWMILRAVINLRKSTI